MGKDKATVARLTAMRLVAASLDSGSAPSGDEHEPPGDSRDSAFARRLAFGVLRWHIALEWLAGELLDRPLKARDQDVRRLILIGLYQLWQEDTPRHAAVHATAECARVLRKPWAVGMINAVLRNFLRDRELLLQQLALAEARHAHPDWMLARFRADWPGDWERIVSGNNTEPPFWLRMNPTRADRAQIEQRLLDAGFELQTAAHAPAALRLTPARPVRQVPGFEEGWLSVQDAAAQLAGPLLQLEPGLRVLDACAAPGGKTCHLLELQPDIRLTALDVEATRLALVAGNLRRLGLNAQLLTGDATRPAKWWDGEPFDRILLDAPCTASGVIRRHPEIRLLRSPAQLEAAVRLQREMLESLWPLLKPGGMLVYATCSVFRAENALQIADFLAAHDDARSLPLTGLPGRSDAAGQQILPGEEDMDGFFYAQLAKRA